jgi:hypothetical protein
MVSVAKIRVLVVMLVFLSFVGEGVVSPAYAAEKCKKGETPVEDIGTGKITCEGDDTLDTNTVAQRPLGRPGKPGLPGKPGSPGMSSGSGENCGLKKWGCEEACQQVYLNQAGGSATGASQRAKVRLGSCKKTCDEKFACEANAPKSP